MALHWIRKQIKYRLLEREWDRLLQPYGGVRHGWEAYRRVKDVDFDYSANTLSGKFRGYSHIAVVTNFEWTSDMFGGMPDTIKAEKLCKQICQHKYRVEWSRVIGCHNDQYLANGQSDRDVIYIGFKSQEDYTQFVLCKE
jgi:hypothetical protein